MDVEHLAIYVQAWLVLRDCPGPSPPLTGGAVYLLIELAARDAPTLQRLSKWQIGPWRTIVGNAFVGAGHCCLGWGVGMCMRIVLG